MEPFLFTLVTAATQNMWWHAISSASRWIGDQYSDYYIARKEWQTMFRPNSCRKCTKLKPEFFWNAQVNHNQVETDCTKHTEQRWANQKLSWNSWAHNKMWIALIADEISGSVSWGGLFSSDWWRNLKHTCVLCIPEKGSSRLFRENFLHKDTIVDLITFCWYV